jgi:hypothetical protein
MSCRDIFWNVETETGERMGVGASIASNEKDPGQRRAENNIDHDEADKRPQSLTDTRRRASRERNRWYVLRNSCLIADNRWRDSIRLNASVFPPHCHAPALFLHYNFSFIGAFNLTETIIAGSTKLHHWPAARIYDCCRTDLQRGAA